MAGNAYRRWGEVTDGEGNGRICLPEVGEVTDGEGNDRNSLPEVGEVRGGE